MTTTVIFDLFGTLIKLGTDSKPFPKLAKRSGMFNVREALQLSLINNCPNLGNYANLIGLEPQKDIEKLESQLQQDLSSSILYEDALPLLQLLRKKGIKTVLISNLATPYKRVIDDFKLEKYFSSTIFSCDFGVSKPDSKIYQFALNEVQSSPSETIMVGDSYLSDVEGPEKIGIKGIHLMRESCVKLGVNSIGSLDELLGEAI